MNELTIEEIFKLLEFNAEHGFFRWKVSHRNVKKGDIAGSVRPDGYRHILVSGKHYLEHRLAWAFVHGEFPIGILDHVNGNKLDNRPGNLRTATIAQNGWNMGPHKGSSTGHKGISKHKYGFYVKISHNNKRKYIGFFKHLEDAISAYKETALLLHGEFARFTEPSNFNSGETH